MKPLLSLYLFATACFAQVIAFAWLVKRAVKTFAILPLLLLTMGAGAQLVIISVTAP